MRKFLMLVGAMIAAATILVVGCTAMVGAGVSQADKEMQAEHDKASITRSQLKSVQMGDSKQTVVATLGKPDDSQHTESSSEFGDSNSDCLYYNVKGSDWTDLQSYQLCFDNGSLTSKNRW